ncbi:MAG: ubiquinone biosynthesis protein UbiB, partial [Alphaproteobacteria bacterium]|nr:ubiquinone biosynthesis protein UbiB [Alphaproteobacteria bacterium]
MFGILGHSLRMMRASFVLAREGVFNQVDPAFVPAGARPFLAMAKLLARKQSQQSDGSNNLAIAITRLGPSYVKLGQFLATRPDIAGMQTARALEALQDRVAPFAQSDAIAAIEKSFDCKIGDLFTDFSAPVAAASIAQVHRAKVKDGDGERLVAVKVLRPGVERNFRRDLSDMYFAARMAERFSIEARRLRFHDVVATLDRSVRIEMDLRLEAAAASEFASNNANDHDFFIAEVDWDRTAHNVLTTSWIDGIALSNLDALREAGHDLPRLGRIVIQSFLRHAIRDGLFHADMHQGNLFADRQGRIAAVDFGIMGRLGRKEQRFLAEILYGFITRNYHRV